MSTVHESPRNQEGTHWYLGVMVGVLLLVAPTVYWATSQPHAAIAPIEPRREKPAKVTEADWPLFRGDALQTGVAKATLPDMLEIRWQVDLKKGIESTAAI